MFKLYRLICLYFICFYSLKAAGFIWRVRKCFVTVLLNFTRFIVFFSEISNLCFNYFEINKGKLFSTVVKWQNELQCTIVKSEIFFISKATVKIKSKFIFCGAGIDYFQLSSLSVLTDSILIVTQFRQLL